MMSHSSDCSSGYLFLSSYFFFAGNMLFQHFRTVYLSRLGCSVKIFSSANLCLFGPTISERALALFMSIYYILSRSINTYFDFSSYKLKSNVKQVTLLTPNILQRGAFAELLSLDKTQFFISLPFWPVAACRIHFNTWLVTTSCYLSCIINTIMFS